MTTSRVNCRVFYGEEARRLAAQGGTTFGGQSGNAYAAILTPPGVAVADQIEFAGTINGADFRENCDSSVPTFGGSLEVGGQKYNIMTSPCVARIGGAEGKLVAIVVIPKAGQAAPVLEITDVYL